MAIAENGLSWHHLAGMVRAAVTAVTSDDRCGGSLGYDDPAGSTSVRTAIARHLEREVLALRPPRVSDEACDEPDGISHHHHHATKGDVGDEESSSFHSAARTTIDPNDIVCAAGLTAITHLVLAALCDPGDGVLLPSPAYAGFDGAVHAASVGAVAIRVCGPAPDQPGDIDTALSFASLTAAANAAEAAGTPVRVLLLASPSNPTGKLYSPGAMLTRLTVLRQWVHVWIILFSSS
jgi:aspartate/methionine/tyrosine aminotransferase